ncbi:hypothetical protein [Streptomyces sp. NPDC048361]|uniref:hypothetical protein n=1 Tax=Streptomyces sp. NPDC048361 TaxID=3154720 RepID=UPI00344AEDF5
MTDNKPGAPSPQTPPLTEEQRVTQQVGVTDMTTEASQALSGMFPFGGPVRFFGTTDFEGHRLNDMIDLVENANPEHLTSAGDALFAAHKAIEEAAGTLDKDIARVAWEGQAGNAFRDWGKALAGHARNLGDFASTAGVQISAAGMGLASVRQAMPPRDHRAEPVKATELPAEKRVAGNAEYEAAVKAEKDRQEAINQMNRLSSFYSVSEQTLAAQQPPVFQPMPAVGVPQPEPGFGPVSPGRGRADRTGTHPYTVDSATPSRSSSAGVTPARSLSEAATAQGHHPGDLMLPQELSPDRVVHTDLNSAGPALSATSQPTVPLPTVPTSVTGPGGSPMPPPLSAVWAPLARGGSKAPERMSDTFAGPRAAAGSASGTERGVSSVTGRTGGPGQVGPKGVAAPGRTPTAQGVTGGTPRPADTSAGRVGSSGGRGQGISGGRPSGMTNGSQGPRAPRSSVVGGGQPASSAQSASRPGQRGAIGAQDRTASSKAPSNRRPAGGSDGVVGTPQGRVSKAQAARNGFTNGGAGLVRRSGDEAKGEEGEGAQSPGHLVEDEESPLPDRPGHVPPVIN